MAQRPPTFLTPPETAGPGVRLAQVSDLADLLWIRLSHSPNWALGQRTSLEVLASHETCPVTLSVGALVSGGKARTTISVLLSPFVTLILNNCDLVGCWQLQDQALWTAAH